MAFFLRATSRVFRGGAGQEMVPYVEKIFGRGKFTSHFKPSERARALQPGNAGILPAEEPQRAWLPGPLASCRCGDLSTALERGFSSLQDHRGKTKLNSVACPIDPGIFW
ncbi:MAG: hypothetical protein D6679_07060 [Candidatus Hydrogenedentota bacterium]|nr:MAG: hypothetical protein D6679_07060 [Candidatus Hydrogenedentota bacterium]